MKLDIRNDEVDSGEIGAREGDAAIDHQPFDAPFAAEAVKGEVHADFAEASERHKDELVTSIVHVHKPFLTSPVDGTIQLSATGSRRKIGMARRRCRTPAAFTPAVARLADQKNIARLDRDRAGRLFENEPPGRVDRLKNAFNAFATAAPR